MLFVSACSPTNKAANTVAKLYIECSHKNDRAACAEMDKFVGELYDSGKIVDQSEFERLVESHVVRYGYRMLSDF